MPSVPQLLVGMGQTGGGGGIHAHVCMHELPALASHCLRRRHTCRPARRPPAAMLPASGGWEVAFWVGALRALWVGGQQAPEPEAEGARQQHEVNNKCTFRRTQLHPLAACDRKSPAHAHGAALVARPATQAAAPLTCVLFYLRTNSHSIIHRTITEQKKPRQPQNRPRAGRAHAIHAPGGLLGRAAKAARAWWWRAGGKPARRLPPGPCVAIVRAVIIGVGSRGR